MAGAWFFTMCVLLIVVWAPTVVFLQFDTWQLLINTATTIITFLLVALLHNDSRRFERANNLRWGALLDDLGIEDPVDDETQKESSS